MYQNLQQLQNSPYYQYPYNQQYQRLVQMEQQQQMNPQYGMQGNNNINQFQNNYIKGRPVVSIEEARASQIDLDGSLFVFTDIGNKKIYTKQINLDGTATLNTYSLVEEVAQPESYVTKAEFDNALALIEKRFNEEKEIKGESTRNTRKNDGKQSSVQ